MQGHEPLPTAASLDSPSVKSAVPAAVGVGFDSGKKIKGRKRHLMVDPLGLVIMVIVTAATVSDQQDSRVIFKRLSQLPEPIARLVLIGVDGTYEGTDFMQRIEAS